MEGLILDPHVSYIIWIVSYGQAYLGFSLLFSSLGRHKGSLSRATHLEEGKAQTS